MSKRETPRSPGKAPIWVAALAATGCQAVSDRGCHEIGWEWASGRVFYTNAGTSPESIQPLGVALAGGETLSVTWIPGETSYTLQVDQPSSALCA
jgi:hypothetical protein